LSPARTAARRQPGNTGRPIGSPPGDRFRGKQPEEPNKQLAEAFAAHELVRASVLSRRDG
jgi:hypothetical protein